MSTFFKDIQGALRAQLSSLPSAPPISWENRNYTPDSKVLYLRATSLQGETVQACLGDSGEDMHDGIFQVDVFIPDNKGRTAWADAIADHFKRGTVLTRNGVNVRIRSTSISPGIKDNHFYIVPVSIVYQAFTPPRVA